MRSLTTAAQTAIAAGNVQPFYLVSVAYPSGTAYYWTGIGTIVWDSQEWTGAGDLTGVSAITQTSDTNAEGITLTFNGANSDTVSSVISEANQTVPVIIYLGFLDSTGVIVVDPVQCFYGNVDVPTLQDDGETVDISITCENALIALSGSSQRRYTQASQAIDYPTDKGFQYVPIVQQWNGAWGGKGGSAVSGTFF